MIGIFFKLFPLLVPSQVPTQYPTFTPTRYPTPVPVNPPTGQPSTQVDFDNIVVHVVLFDLFEEKKQILQGKKTKKSDSCGKEKYDEEKIWIRKGENRQREGD